MRNQLVAAALLAVALPTMAAKAQDATVRQACSSDFHTVCSGVPPGGGRIKQCMIEKFDKLSDGCKTALKDAKAQQGGK